MNAPPSTLVDNFMLGMDREILPFSLPPREGAIINLGAGKKHIEGAIPLDAERGWYAGQPFPVDGKVSAVYAYHFFEHLTKDEIISVLRECGRVLVPGGVINIVVPHWSSEAAHQDLDHKSFFSESTWKNLFLNPYYDGTMPREWLLYERCTVIMGVVQRNLAVVTQLQKKEM